jgi:hypothetical protein
MAASCTATLSSSWRDGANSLAQWAALGGSQREISQPFGKPAKPLLHLWLRIQRLADDNVAEPALRDLHLAEIGFAGQRVAAQFGTCWPQMHRAIVFGAWARCDERSLTIAKRRSK